MAIRTRLQPKRKWTFVIGAAVCIAVGLWGAYDAFVKIPQQSESIERLTELRAERDYLEEVASGRALSDEEADRYDEIREEMSAIGSVERPGRYDRAIKLWVYFVGTGLVCSPFFIYPLLRHGRNVYVLDDDGRLHFPDGQSWSRDEIADIDMSRWMEKSIAEVVHVNGERRKLDDFWYRNVHLIVGTLASEMYPDQWMPDARMIRPSADSSDAPEPAADAKDTAAHNQIAADEQADADEQAGSPGIRG